MTMKMLKMMANKKMIMNWDKKSPKTLKPVEQFFLGNGSEDSI